MEKFGWSRFADRQKSLAKCFATDDFLRNRKLLPKSIWWIRSLRKNGNWGAPAKYTSTSPMEETVPNATINFVIVNSVNSAKVGS